jgi:dipeptidase D
MARTLDHLRRASSFRLAGLKGGIADNAIARDCDAWIACRPTDLPALQQSLADFQASLRREFAFADPGLTLSLAAAGPGAPTTVTADTGRIIHLLLALPQGVAEMSPHIPGFVETSNNVGITEFLNGELHTKGSQRSSVASRLDEMNARIEAAAALAGARVEHTNHYPSWEPDIHSELLQRCQRIYEETFGKAPKIEAIHAGLECGLIGQKYPGIQMVSLGATLQNPHSPNERVNVPAIGKVWTFLTALCESYRAG